jgi:hypothetical protein
VQQPDGSWKEVDRTQELLGQFPEHSIDALITVGGDSSPTIGGHFHRNGMRVIGVPKTIDNDLDKTTATFGFDSAVGLATPVCPVPDRSTQQCQQQCLVGDSRTTNQLRPPRPCHQRDRPTGRTSPSSSTATCRVEMPSPATRARNSASIPTVPGSPLSTQNFANQMIGVVGDVDVSGPINSYPERGAEAR